MKRGLIQILFFVLILISGERTPERIVISEQDLITKDSILIDYVLTKFDYSNDHRSNFKGQLKEMRTGRTLSSGYTIRRDTTIGEYKLIAFQFDSESYPPFVIEVTKTNSELVSFFSFTDELYYMSNNLGPDFHSSDTLILSRRKIDKSVLVGKINLERNLNDLIYKLGYQNNDRSISNLIETIFIHLLKMQKFQESEFTRMLGLVKTTDSVTNLINEEKRLFIKSDNSSKTFIFESKEGSFGYWRLDLIRDGDGFKVKTRFFSDVVYTALFM
ncbi:MAG TPA: hypothetical protein VL443_11710 [Cyclobacteriaceae bacterium]|jgi:hypothetical protein|nr:hypothetical protein [Cyclobacteriaceae bacterium]